MPDREDAPEKENGSGKKLAGLFQKKNLPITIVGTLLVVMLVVFAVGMAGQQRIASAAAPSSASGTASAASSGTGAVAGVQAAGGADSEKSAGLSGGGTDTVRSQTLSGGAPDESGSSGSASSEEDSSAVSSGDASSGNDTGYAVSGTPFRGTEGNSSAAAPDDFSGSEVSRQEYDSLTTGMTYSQVAAAVGGEGSLTGKTGDTATYEWKGYGTNGAIVRIEFKSGKLAYKYQFGL